MKQLNFIFPLILIGLLLGACSKDEVIEMPPSNNDNTVQEDSVVISSDTTIMDTIDPNKLTVDTVVVSRYAGLWYEIASFPQIFQSSCNCTTAEYAALSENQISVFNSCNLGSPDGFQSEIEGSATIVPGSGNAKLLVSFFGTGGSDYWIMDLDEDYQWAVVGSPDRETFWILSRTTEFDQTLYEELLAKFTAKGFDMDRIRVTNHDGCS